MVGQCTKLGIINMTEEAFLHVDIDETDLSGVLVQGHKDNYKVVSMLDREFMVTE